MELDEATRRLNRLVQNLLDLSRLEAGHLRMNTDWHDLRDLVHAALQNLGRILDRHEIKIDIPDDFPPVKLDAVLTEQILVNLLGNAAVHTPPGTTGGIFSARAKRINWSCAWLTTAPVCRRAIRRDLFDRFQRGPDAVAGGTGIGLSLVKGFAEAQGGSVSAENRAGGGAVFTVKLPLTKLPPRAGGKRMNFDKPLVLIVDDEPQIRRLLTVTLEANGYRVLSAASGQEGLVLAAQHRPALVILDLGLPDLSGQEVLRRLREWSNAPVIVLSVQDDEKGKVAALDAGADDYVTKPFNTDELLARLRVALRRSTKTEEAAVVHAKNLVVDLATRRVTVSGKEVKLSKIEYDLLRLLARHAGKVLTHRQILQEVWGRAMRTTRIICGFILPTCAKNSKPTRNHRS